MKLVKPQFVVDATVQLGYPESAIVGIGLVLVACTVCYLVPRTSFLGAILLTGYLGGAVATHVRAGSGLFPVSFPVALAGAALGRPRPASNRLGALLFNDRARATTPRREMH